jgi:hypothetical protein
MAGTGIFPETAALPSAAGISLLLHEAEIREARTKIALFLMKLK